MPGKAAKITLTEGQREILLTLCKSAGESPQLRQRATIILLAFDGLRNNEIAAEVGLGQRFVGRWRRRWAKGWDGLVDIECGETRADLRRAIEGILTDEPRTGARPKFSPDQITRILAVARDAPEFRVGGHSLDGPRTDRRSRQTRHCRVNLGVPGATLPPRGGAGPSSESVPARSDREGSAAGLDNDSLPNYKLIWVPNVGTDS